VVYGAFLMVTCSFCNRPRNEVKALVPSRDNKTFICDGCLREGTRTLSAPKGKDDAADAPLPKPNEIIARLHEYVIGQNMAKGHVAAAVYEHYKRRDALRRGFIFDGQPVEIEKSNILVTGPTGSGKTQMARTIARLLRVPLHVGDATRITQAGYAGDDPETLIQGLLEKCAWDVEKAKWGMIVIDEIDKLARKSGREVAGYRDVSGEGVQQALLKIIEGGEVTVSRGLGARIGDPTKEAIVFDTSNVLFICMGSFAGIDNLVGKRLNQDVRLGFGGMLRTEFQHKELYGQITDEDLIEFGIIPELVGRLPVLTSTLPLEEDELVRILTEPKDAITRQMQALYAMEGVDLQFDDAALLTIARKAKQRPTGARALRGILKALFLPYDLEIPSRPEIQSMRVTADFVLGRSGPVLVERPRVEAARA
jgi:ATP-dependent Clp protease ATP-binding subunit ClpX